MEPPTTGAPAFLVQHSPGQFTAVCRRVFTAGLRQGRQVVGGSASPGHRTASSKRNRSISRREITFLFPIFTGLNRLAFISS